MICGWKSCCVSPLLTADEDILLWCQLKVTWSVTVVSDCFCWVYKWIKLTWICIQSSDAPHSWSQWTSLLYAATDWLWANPNEGRSSSLVPSAQGAAVPRTETLRRSRFLMNTPMNLCLSAHFGSHPQIKKWTNKIATPMLSRITTTTRIVL